MVFPNQDLKPEVLRSIAFGSISGTYANIGTITLHPWRIVFFSNTTDADMIISWNGGVTDNMVVPASSSASLDCAANGIQGSGTFIPQSTQFAVKQVSAPSKGSVYVSGFYT